MAGKTRPMSQIKQLLRLHQQGKAKKEIARILGISKNTVKSYLHKYESSGYNIDDLLEFDDPVLESKFHLGNPSLSISVLFVPGISVKMCQSERWCNSTKKMLFAC